MKLGEISSIPIHVHSSVFVLAGLYLGWAAYQFGPAALPIAALAGAGLVVSVVLHELGHALAGAAYGVRTAHITLYPFGGVAALEREPRSAAEELAVSAAGPAVNAALFVLLGLAWAATGWRMLLVWSAANLLMALFNLLPAFPMDGGRMLRAALATRVGWRRATDHALRLGQVFGWLFVGGGLLAGSLSALLTGALLLGAIHVERRRVVWASTFGRERVGY